jgi:hypoxanthine phosphoribosyltransferase
MVGVLKGSFVFMADLVRRLDLPVTIDFLALSSYAAGTTTSGEVKLLKDLDVALAGRHVIVVEDIVDTGLTLSYLHEILRARGPASLRTACLLSKPSRRKVGVAVIHRLHHRGPVRGRLWSRLRRAAPAPAYIGIDE